MKNPIITKKLDLICEKCQRDYPVWNVDNPTWNEVMREPSTGKEDFSFLCPTCFVVRAAMMAVAPIWKLRSDERSQAPYQEAQRETAREIWANLENERVAHTFQNERGIGMNVMLNRVRDFIFSKYLQPEDKPIDTNS